MLAFARTLKLNNVLADTYIIKQFCSYISQIIDIIDLESLEKLKFEVKTELTDMFKKTPGAINQVLYQKAYPSQEILQVLSPDQKRTMRQFRINVADLATSVLLLKYIS